MVRINAPAVTTVTVNIQGWDGSAWQNLLVDPSKHLLVNIGGLPALAVGQVAIGAVATLIKAANTSRKEICVKNIGNNDVDLGASGVTFGTGFRLKPGEALGGIRTTAALYAICGAGLTSSVCYFEE